MRQNFDISIKFVAISFFIIIDISNTDISKLDLYSHQAIENYGTVDDTSQTEI